MFQYNQHIIAYYIRKASKEIMGRFPKTLEYLRVN
jgi:hypothetical protein